MITKSHSRFDRVSYRESGVADLSYLNELKIVGAPSNLIGKKVRLTFSQERLQPVNTTITLRQCEKGFQASPFTAREGLFTCTPCPAQQYNVISGGKCHDCPTVGAVCLGRNDVYVLPGYYGHINSNAGKTYGEISVVECIGGNCCPRVNGSSLDTYDINGIGCRIGSGLDCATNRNSSTPLCGRAILGIAKF